MMCEDGVCEQDSRQARRTTKRRKWTGKLDGRRSRANKQACRSIELDTGMLDKKERKGLSEKGR